MAITYVAANNAVGQAAGVTTPAGTAAITPTFPAGVTFRDRVFVVQVHNGASDVTPTNWNVLGTKDTAIASSLGAVTAGGGQRFMTVYWRDYSDNWGMPAFSLVSAVQNTHWIGCIAIRPTSGKQFDTPTISSVASDVGTADTAHSATTGSAFQTIANAFLILGYVNNDNVTATTEALTQTGATFGAVTERCDGGSATGNDVSGKVATCSVTTGANATVTVTATLSAASQGGNLIVQQTESTPPKIATLTEGFDSQDTAKWEWDRGNLNQVATGSQLQLPVASGAGAVATIDTYTKSLYDLTASAIFVKFVQPPNVGNGTTEAYFYLESKSDGSDYIAWICSGGTMYCRQMVASTPSDTTAAYNATTHAWLRIQESGGNLLWDTSPDGINWTNQRTVAIAVGQITGLAVQFYSSYFGTETTPGTAIFDSVNIAPAAGPPKGNFFRMF